MVNNEYNLNNVHFFKIIAVCLLFLNLGYNYLFADDIVAIVEDKKGSLYAIFEIDGSKKKLYTKGDIIYSKDDMNKCFRIDDIKEDEIILKEVNSKDEIFTLKKNQKIPVDGSEIVFKKTIETDVIQYRYKDSKSNGSSVPDFSVASTDKTGIILEREYTEDFTKEEDKIFDDTELNKKSREIIKAEAFEAIQIKKVKEGLWNVDKKSAEAAINNAGGSLFSVIKRVRPRFRLSEGFYLKFNCELGKFVLNRQGFLIDNLALAKLGEKAGIKRGDLILSVNGRPVNTLYGLYKSYKDVRSGKGVKVVKINIIRNEKEETLVYNLQ